MNRLLMLNGGDEAAPGVDELDLVELAEEEPQWSEEELEELRAKAIQERNYCARLVRRPKLKDGEHTDQRTMFLNLCQVPGENRMHFSYVINFNLYTRWWQCSKCMKTFLCDIECSIMRRSVRALTWSIDFLVSVLPYTQPYLNSWLRYDFCSITIQD